MSTFKVGICKIEDIKKHPSADRLELVYVKGWQCVCQSGLHHIGKTVIYVPTDSILPKTLSDKLNITKYLKRGRVKTSKLRGKYSQGVIIPMEYLPNEEYELGDDVAKFLNITKFEPDIPPKFKGDCVKEDPRFISYTNIENIKNFPDIFEDGEFVSITEKIHGTNFRISKIDGKLHVGSHRRDLKKTVDNLYWQIADKFDFENILDDGDILYGEIYGKNVQKLEYGCQTQNVRFFDLIRQKKYVGVDEFLVFCEKNNLLVVPHMFVGSWHKDLMKFASGKSLIFPSQIREGVVIKPIKERTWGSNKRRVIFKNINVKYLLKDWDIIPH